jgi:large subunit ribosomal protein L4
MKLDVLSTEGKSTGRSVDLADDIFGIEPNEHVVYLDVKQYLANQRQGTHKAKERGEIKGSTRKIKKQKGTGTARAGSIKNPLFRGGGRVFGPRPRKYTVRLNKKVKKLARQSVLADKAQNGNIMVVEDFTFESPKTNAYVGVLKNLNVEGHKTLLVTNEYDNALHLSSRNVQGTKVMLAQNLNSYDMLKAGKIILSESSVEVITDIFKK